MKSYKSTRPPPAATRVVSLLPPTATNGSFHALLAWLTLVFFGRSPGPRRGFRLWVRRVEPWLMIFFILSPRERPRLPPAPLVDNTRRFGVIPLIRAPRMPVVVQGWPIDEETKQSRPWMPGLTSFRWSPTSPARMPNPSILDGVLLCASLPRVGEPCWECGGLNERLCVAVLPPTTRLTSV